MGSHVPAGDAAPAPDTPALPARASHNHRLFLSVASAHSGYDEAVAADFADFENPPVREAVIGVEFNPLPLNIVELARLCERWSERFPVIQEQPALDPSIAVGAGAGMPVFQFGNGVPPLRLWLIEPSGHFLVQVQRDRLLLNWRKVTPQSVYPRYDALRQKFTELLDDFRDFVLSAHADATIAVTVTEFTYINGITTQGSADSVFEIIREPSTPLPGEPLMLRFQEVRNLEHPTILAPGQLSVSSEPVVVGGVSEFQLTVSTKFFPTSITEDASVMEVLDEARKISRQAFVSFTTEEMHSNWGLANE